MIGFANMENVKDIICIVATYIVLRGIGRAYLAYYDFNSYRYNIL